MGDFYQNMSLRQIRSNKWIAIKWCKISHLFKQKKKSSFDQHLKNSIGRCLKEPDLKTFTGEGQNTGKNVLSQNIFKNMGSKMFSLCFKNLSVEVV